jgi:chitin disaccharide deacetylase
MAQMISTESPSNPIHAERCRGQEPQTNALIINADDWGIDRKTTDRIFECIAHGSVSSASAMVFMQDSERAARIALEESVDCGLHVNFTTPFAAGMSTELADRHRKIAKYLRRSRFGATIYNPRLARHFEYVMAAQIDEFRRLYGKDPGRIDGHHHMHLCMNVLMGRLLPAGIFVRRNFTFAPGEKGIFNRAYRKAIDAVLGRKHRLVDYFFQLEPLEPQSRLKRIFDIAKTSVVEVETHPVIEDEFRFLSGCEIFKLAGVGSVMPRFVL